ncbi:MAG: bifunctional precorrin-2 dehydrogenase/sirohydrochlorin ferrochelatase [Actinomycetes bacterium]
MTGSPAYLAALDLRGRHVLVASAGRVAERRIPALLDAGALVHVVAPHATAAVRAWADAGVLTWSPRPVEDSDATGVWYAQALTDAPAVNAAVVAACATQRVFCVRGDDGRAGTARTPATGTVDDLTIGVVGDRDPRRSARARDAAVRAVADAFG